MSNMWRKIASATTGGKPYFYLSATGSRCVVWDRLAQAWVARIEDHGCILSTIGYYKTAAAAKRAAERGTVA